MPSTHRHSKPKPVFDPDAEQAWMDDHVGKGMPGGLVNHYPEGAGPALVDRNPTSLPLVIIEPKTTVVVDPNPRGALTQNPGGLDIQSNAITTNHPRGIYTTPPGFWVSNDGQKIFPASRVRTVRRAQDAMTAHEERVYSLLWRLNPDKKDGEDWSVRCGAGKISREIGMDRKNATEILRRMQRKLMLEEIEPSNEMTSQAALYRVYSFVSILSRLRSAGAVNFVRSGNGVLFVKPLQDPGGFEPMPPGALQEDPRGVAPHDPRGATPPQLANSAQQEGPPPPTSSSSCVEPVIKATVAAGMQIDDDAVKRALSKSDPSLTEAEAVYFAQLTTAKIRAMKNLDRPSGMWIKQFGNFASGNTLEIYRKARADQAEADRIHKLEMDEIAERVWRPVLDDPKATESDKNMARQMLKL